MDNILDFFFKLARPALTGEWPSPIGWLSRLKVFKPLASIGRSLCVEDEGANDRVDKHASMVGR